jgi:hypothetical protein
VDFLLDHAESLDFVLTQVVSHHLADPVARFMEEAARRGLALPLFAGVFFYRSARRRTLDLLSRFIPVPRAEIERDFGERGLSAVDLAAATLRRLSQLGVNRFYLSNLETGRASRRLEVIASRAGLPSPTKRATHRSHRR